MQSPPRKLQRQVRSRPQDPASRPPNRSWSGKKLNWAGLQAIGSQGCISLAPQTYASQRDSQPGCRDVSSCMTLHQKAANKVASQATRCGITIIPVRFSLVLHNFWSQHMQQSAQPGDGLGCSTSSSTTVTSQKLDRGSGTITRRGTWDAHD